MRRKREKQSHPSNRHRRAIVKKAVEVQAEAAPEVFITKDDLSHFLSIKPYLSDKAQMIVDLLAEVAKTSGRLELSSLTRLMGLLGGGDSNLGALTSLAGMAGSGGKLDPTALLSLLGTLGQTGQ